MLFTNTKPKRCLTNSEFLIMSLFYVHDKQLVYSLEQVEQDAERLTQQENILIQLEYIFSTHLLT